MSGTSNIHRRLQLLEREHAPTTPLVVFAGEEASRAAEVKEAMRHSRVVIAWPVPRPPIEEQSYVAP